MDLYWPFLFADYYRTLEYFTAAVAVIILLSCIDDLLIDAIFYIRAIKRRFAAKKYRYKPLQPEQLLDRPEQHMAVMVPAWLEFDVIAAMVDGMVRTLDYRNYTIFVGTYQNDKETIQEVERLLKRYRQLVRVEVPHDGPTCKADCLNWVVQAIFAHEKKHNIQFAGTVLHDSEDVLHPLELRFFNYLLPRIDLIQIPVNSLERNWYELVAGVYMDEFAEWHGKDIVVREAMSGMVPSAGVGTCFSRKALMTLAAETDNQPFNTQTLTEDYDIGVRLAEHGMRSILARFIVDYRIRRKSWFGFGPEREKTVRMPLCVQEYFPNTFRASYRQKARWSLGICFQGWAYFGWYGSLVDRYFLLRDRKAIVTSFVTIFAYALALQYIVFQLAAGLGLFNTRYPPLLSVHGWVGTVLILNAIALFLRISQRFYFTSRYFGWEHGLLSIPRMVVGNFVNFMAMARALKQYVIYLVTGRRLVWDKTMHDFPSADGLAERKARIGDLLVNWQAIDTAQLDHALEKQREQRLPLGRILLDEGWLQEEVLAEAVAFQSGLELRTITQADVTRALGVLSVDLCLRWRVLPVDLGDDDGKVRLATALPVEAGFLAGIEAKLGYVPECIIVRDSQVAAGLDLLCEREAAIGRQVSRVLNDSLPRLGDILVERGHVSPEALQEALADYSPQRDGLIGAYLAARDAIFSQAVEDALAEQRRRIEQLREQERRTEFQTAQREAL